MDGAPGLGEGDRAVSAVYEVVREVARSGHARWSARKGWLAALVIVCVAALGWRAIVDSFVEQRLYALGMVASVGVVVAIASGLRSALHASEKNAAELMDAYMRAQHEIEQLDRSYRVRLHDARSAATSVRCAVDLLNQRANTRRTDDRKLQRMLTAELERMQALLDPTASEPFGDFDLAEVLEPIVLANRLGGTQISAELESVHVHGRAQATASVLDNVLRNVRVHAPGAQVRIRVNVDDEFAAVVVDDDGPGIPSEECEKMLLPGTRGSAVTAPVIGLGLHIGATNFSAQSGALRLSRLSGHGTRVVFALPVATSQPDRLAPLHPSLAS